VKEGKLFKSKNEEFYFPDEKLKQLEQEYAKSDELQMKVISKYFGDCTTDIMIIKNWFENLTIDFFNEYNSDWVSDLAYKTEAVARNRKRIEKLIQKNTERNKKIRKKDKIWLKKRYLDFITANDSDVDQILWVYGITAFSASLVTANTSINPITIDAFSDSVCVLDTNVLIDLPLEGGDFIDAFKELEEIFILLNIKPVYLHITKEEYERVIEHLINDILRIADAYQIDVLSNLDDKFIKTAIKRGCVEIEDFERFCQGILNISNVFYEELAIEELDYPELINKVDEGTNSAALKKDINKIFKKHTNKDKKENALIHDAGLISGAKYLRDEKKVFILSKEISVCGYSKKNLIRDEIPLSIHLEILIKVLAINNGGLDIDPTKFAPLFANMVKLSLLPQEDCFKVEDLSRMLDVQEQIADLPSEEVISMAKELNRELSLGKKDNEISLLLTRRFQRAKLNLQSDLEKEKKEKLFQERQAKLYENESSVYKEKLRKKYKTELIDKYEKEIRWSRIVWFLVLPIITCVVTFFIIQDDEYSFQEMQWWDHFIGLLINLVAWFLTSVLLTNRKINSKYSERVSNIDDKVEELLEEDIPGGGPEEIATNKA